LGADTSPYPQSARGQARNCRLMHILSVMDRMPLMAEPFVSHPNGQV